jgi:soluble lytic murein transglycosylase-like protein
MKKKLIVLLSLCLVQSFYGEDYSLGNSNPFTKYHYEPLVDDSEVVDKVNKNINYIDNHIKIDKKNISKYSNLFNNAEKIKGCWDTAGKTYNVDPWLLMAVAHVESGFNNKAINVNTNKSVDMGIMQINSIWLPTLKQHGISKDDLFNPCTSIFVGAWIMAQNIKKFGYNQDGIGAYNSPGNVTIRRNYAQLVYKSYNQLVNDFVVKK